MSSGIAFEEPMPYVEENIMEPLSVKQEEIMIKDEALHSSENPKEPENPGLSSGTFLCPETQEAIANLKKMDESAQSGSGAKKTHSYINVKQLSFLRRTLEPRPTVSSMDPSTSGSQEHQPMLPSASASCSLDVEQCEAESQLEEEEDTAGQVPVTRPTDTTGPASRRKREAGGNFKQTMLSFNEAHQPPPPPRCMVVENDDMIFFRSCLPMLQRMNHDQILEFRQCCIDTIHSILARPQHPPMSRSAVPEPHCTGG